VPGEAARDVIATTSGRAHEKQIGQFDIGRVLLVVPVALIDPSN